VSNGGARLALAHRQAEILLLCLKEEDKVVPANLEDLAQLVWAQSLFTGQARITGDQRLYAPKTIGRQRRSSTTPCTPRELSEAGPVIGSLFYLGETKTSETVLRSGTGHQPARRPASGPPKRAVLALDLQRPAPPSRVSALGTMQHRDLFAAGAPVHTSASQASQLRKPARRSRSGQSSVASQPVQVGTGLRPINTWRPTASMAARVEREPLSSIRSRASKRLCRPAARRLSNLVHGRQQQLGTTAPTRGSALGGRPNQRR